MEPTASACTVDECAAAPFTKLGLCSKHYYRMRRHGSVETVLIGNKSCTVEGCQGRKHQGNGLCALHYGRQHRASRPQCVAQGCEKRSAMREYCWEHGCRLKRRGTLERPEPSTRRVDALGYVLLKRPDHVLVGNRGWVFEHRIVLHEAIGPGWHPCHHCGVLVNWDLTYPESPDALVVDHLDEDRSNNDRHNLVPSCSACNLARSHPSKKRHRREKAS